ncbi:MAG: hypothetical protein ACO1RT_17795 [Planctomycetaceae bacterium]
MNDGSERQPAGVDYGFRLILALMMVVVAWLLAMPFSRTVQRTSLERFHLQTKSFAWWSLQQPIPAMYNFYNRFEIRPSPWRTDTDEVQYAERGTVNHFPLRMFTFGDNRAIFLTPGRSRRIDIWSSYRGEELHTHWTATPTARGGFDLTGEVVE